MIRLTRLDGKEFLLNAQLIETVSETPDTVIVLSNGHSMIVRESMNEITTRIIEYNRLRRRAVFTNRSDKPLT